MPHESRAQNLFGDAGFSSSHGTYSSAPYEHVDPLSGNLTVVVTDLSLPGNAGLGLSVTRSYNSKFHRDFEHSDFALDERTPLGVGWRLHFGRVLHADSTQPGQTVIETPDGGGQPLYQSAGGHGWMSKAFWRYDRQTNTAYLPNGLKYVFGYIGETSGPRGRVLYVTEIRDQFNNLITFEYGGNGSLPGSIWRIRQHLSPTQIREVTFSYNGNGSLDTMAYDGRVWSYEYVPAPGWPNEWVLDHVLPPAGLQWKYVYANHGVGPELTGLRPPGGGEMNYEYATVSRQASTLIQWSRVVTSRATGGARITPGTWTFTYNQGPYLDTTVIDCPCGKMTFRYAGIGTEGPFNAWKSGVLLERTIAEPGSSTPLEREVFEYQPSGAISGDPVPGQNGVWSDPAVYQALVTQRVLTRESQSWRTYFDYRTTNYNDFGRAWRTTAQGDKTRVTERTFNYDFAPLWIVDRVATESVTIGGETRTSAITYDSNGFVTRTDTFGLIADYEPNAAGQVAKVKDQHNHDTTFTYQWGVVANTVTPLLTTSRAINPDGTVDSETVGTLTTRYIYDVGGRLRKVRPSSHPNVNEIVYDYDDTNTYFIRSSRGTSQTEELLDGFGRVMSTSNQVGIKTKVERDACGRVTFASAPFTGQNPTRGTTTTYDALGRPKTVTAPGTPTSVTTNTYTGADVSIQDAEGRTTSYNYDAFSGPGDARLMRVTDATGTHTNYEYDILGGLKRVQGPGPVPDRVWSYNARGELVLETQPESGTTTYAYDNAGVLTQVTNAAGQVTTFTYDQNDRLKTRTVAGDSSSNLSITYDSLGRVQEQSISGVVTTFGYDAAGRPSSRTDGIHPGMVFTSSYLYDANDNLSTTIYPSGRQVAYQYDVEFRLTNVLNNGGPFASNFTYDTSGRLSTYYTGAVAHAITYDDRDRVRQLTSGPGVAHMHLTYSYDKVSNVTSILDQRANAVPATQGYTYDVLDRMKTANGPWGGITWNYDSAGNRLSEIRGTTTNYAYNPTTNRLTETTGANAEAFTWNALGQLTQDQRGITTTTYQYTPAGMLKSATHSGLSASYLYDAAHLRVKRDVNGMSVVTVRSWGGQVLSEYQIPCSGGSPVWSRDNIYAGSRLLGAVRANGAPPTVEFQNASSSIGETGGVTPNIKVITANGAPLACPLSIGFETRGGTATAGYDFVMNSYVMTIPAGTASGSPIPLSPIVNILPDPYYEPNESFSIVLTGGTGVTVVNSASTHYVTIQNDDAPPTMSINDITIVEAGTYAIFTVSLSELSGYETTVTYGTANGTARGAWDFHHASGTAVISPFMPSTQIRVLLIDDARAEPSETFNVSLWGATNGTVADGVGMATITDNEPPRAPIDLSLPGAFFADGTAIAGQDDYVTVNNIHHVPVVARLTFTLPNGAGTTRDVSIPSRGRYSFRVGDEPGLAGQQVSIAVQPAPGYAAYQMFADHAVYEGSSWQAGRATEGVTPSSTWYFAEGAIGYFDQTLTVFNPSSGPVDVYIDYYGTTGPLWQQAVYHIEEGPGRIRFKVGDAIGPVDNGMRIVARDMSGALTPIVVERTMSWPISAGLRETHSSPGVSQAYHIWNFAEGSTGFATYILLLNPNPTTENVQVKYLHENGTAYDTIVTMSPNSRMSVAPPGWLPAGDFGIRVGTYSGAPIAAERSMYTGTDWTIGHNGVGVTTPSTYWTFSEGSTGSFWDTYFLVANPNPTESHVWFAFRQSNGTEVQQYLNVPAWSRRTLSVNAVPGMSNAAFKTEIFVGGNPGTPVVVERATYWPGAGSSGMMTAGGEMGQADAQTQTLESNESSASAASATAAITGRDAIGAGLGAVHRPSRSSPYNAGRRVAMPNFMYRTVTTGEPAGPVEGALAEAFRNGVAPPTTELTIGGVTFGSMTQTGPESLLLSPENPATSSSVTSSSGWHGAHVTGGRRP